MASSELRQQAEEAAREMEKRAAHCIALGMELAAAVHQNNATLLLQLSAALPEWRPISEAEHGVKVIAGYYNTSGKWRTITARFFDENILEAPEDSYDPYAEPGWYEESETHEDLLPCAPTHFMPLPTPPIPTEEKR